ncbi:hypothetical protein D1007_18263 [Hordeum vulgare]|nr:hypothetical protein D1007_18263 [Hordeum vulgare]
MDRRVLRQRVEGLHHGGGEQQVCVYDRTTGAEGGAAAAGTRAFSGSECKGCVAVVGSSRSVSMNNGVRPHGCLADSSPCTTASLARSSPLDDHAVLNSCSVCCWFINHLDEDDTCVQLMERGCSVRSEFPYCVFACHMKLSYPRPDDPYLLLHSTAYGRYLGVTFKPSSLGHHGCRTEQHDYDNERDLMAVMWWAADAGFRGIVLLRSVSGRFLRAKGTSDL